MEFSQPMLTVKLNSKNSSAILFQPPLLQYKRAAFPLFLGTWVWFSIRPCVQNCNSLLFPNKPNPLEKYMTVSLLKVSTPTPHLGEQSSAQHQTPISYSVFQAVQKALLSDTLLLVHSID